MKNQKNNKTSLFAETGIQLAGMTLLVFAIFTLLIMDTEPTYTQSDVSALMKFNASEFGCDKVELEKTEHLIARCYEEHNFTIFGKWYIFELFDEKSYHAIYSEINEVWELPTIIDYDLPNDIDEKIEKNGFLQIGNVKFNNLEYSEFWFENKTAVMLIYIKNYTKNFTYFSQFADISVVVEPERQECVNKSVIIGYAYYNRSEWKSIEIPDFNITISQNGKEIPIWFDRNDFNLKSNYTSCQTIPAVTRQINPWAVSENDLATEFCESKGYEFDVRSFCVRQENPKEYDFCVDDIRRYQQGKGWVKGLIIDKSFTRGEVVEATCPTKKELSCSQKLIRCIGDDGTTKDFGDVLK